MKYLKMRLNNIIMNNNLIKIGIPSKGRLRKDILNIFRKNKLKLTSEKGKRDLVGYISGRKNIKILYLHAREIVESLGNGSLDIGFSGYDLLMESEINIQNKINIIKKYSFGKATLVIAVPDAWIDVQTIADLEEIAFEFKDLKKKRLRVSSKYLNLTRDFLYSKGVTQFTLVKSLGSTEVAPFTGTAEIISDITSTGATLKANSLRVLKDGEILKSQACLMMSKLFLRKKGIKKIINLLSK